MVAIRVKILLVVLPQESGRVRSSLSRQIVFNSRMREQMTTLSNGKFIASKVSEHGHQGDPGNEKKQILQQLP